MQSKSLSCPAAGCQTCCVWTPSMDSVHGAKHHRQVRWNSPQLTSRKDDYSLCWTLFLSSEGEKQSKCLFVFFSLTCAGSLCLVRYNDRTMSTTCWPRSNSSPDPWQRVSRAAVSTTQGWRSDCALCGKSIEFLDSGTEWQLSSSRSKFLSSNRRIIFIPNSPSFQPVGLALTWYSKIVLLFWNEEQLVQHI